MGVVGFWKITGAVKLTEKTVENQKQVKIDSLGMAKIISTAFQGSARNRKTGINTKVITRSY